MHSMRRGKKGQEVRFPRSWDNRKIRKNLNMNILQKVWEPPLREGEEPEVKVK